MKDNMPVLYQNIMLGLPSEEACAAFLWAVERPNEDRFCYRAEKFAREVDALLEPIRAMLGCAAEIHGQDAYDPDIVRFIAGRHANLRYGGNTRPKYVETLR